MQCEREVVSKMWNANHPEAKQMHNIIMEMMALDNQPFSIVEDSGFKRLIEHLAPKYKIPSRKFFSTTMLDKLFNECRLEISNSLQNMIFASFTSDIWTCSGNNESFISFSVHWIDTDFELKHAVLNSKHFPLSHTSDHIANEFRVMLTNWNILPSQLHLIITDNAANMRKGI